MAGRLRRRELRAEQLVEAALARVERVRGLNCFISVRADAARAEARRADAELARGRDRGPLHGLPVSLKDNIALAGEPTTAGSPALAGWRPGADAAVVRRLREAGAVVIGKANLYELAFGAPHPRFGPTRNPWDLSRSCAGSSSGSACAVAAGLGHGSVGTDTGGSLRLPAAMCGVVALKPTYGRVPCDGIVPVSPALDHAGPIARSVEDCAILLAALTGTLTAAAQGGVGAEADAVALAGDRPAGTGAAPPLAGLRVGLPARQPGERLDPAVAAAVAAMAATLESEGAALVGVDLPDLARARAIMWEISSADAAAAHAHHLDRHPELLHPVVRGLLEAGRRVDARARGRADRERADLARGLRRALEPVDAILMPACPVAAYPIGAERVTVDGDPMDVLDALSQYTPLANLGGQPALVLPCGTTPDGLPVAAQLVARHGAEGLLLRVGRAYQRVSAWHARRPPPTAC